MTDIAIRVENLSKLYKIGARQNRHDTLRDKLTEVVTAPFRRICNRPSSIFNRSSSNPPSSVVRPRSSVVNSSVLSHRSSVPGPPSSIFHPRSSVVNSSVLGPRSSVGNTHTIWALRDVSFEVKRGEVVGIIGRNGAGKTTLLKILSRITEPTEGQAEIHGRVSSLLEVGTGFHPELTGRENIFLNGAILGMKKAEIDRKFDEIVAFAEIEKFIDTPVKHYSSGMYVRLAFAVAAHLEPEILLVDEVLAVGDAAFQKKCLGKMGDVAKEGRTVVFVSHNMAAIQRLCSKAIWLEEGTIALSGEAKDVVLSYLSATIISKSIQTIEMAHPRNTENQVAYFLSWSISPSLGGQYCIVSGTDISIDLDVEFKRPVRDVYFGIALWSDDGILVWAANSHDGNRSPEIFDIGTYIIQFQLKHVALKPGSYWVEASINSIDGQLDRWHAYPCLQVLPSRPTVLPSAWQGIVEFEYVFLAHRSQPRLVSEATVRKVCE